MLGAVRSILIAGLLAAAPLTGTSAETLLPNAATPEDVGLSGGQLARLEATTRAHIEKGLLPGAIMLVVRDDKIAWRRVMGMRDRDKGEPMKPDSLFRIYSMTKPVVSVAIMMLVEQGRMQIGDPVSRLLAQGGTLHGKRLLSPQTPAFMTADHVGATPGRPPGMGFGLGFEERKSLGMAVLPGSEGEYGWAGNAGTPFWIDPKRKLMALYMVQANVYDRVFLRNQFRTMVQAAIMR